MSQIIKSDQQLTPVSLIQTALQSNADIEKLQQLMDLQERWEKNQARKAFFESLARFQSIVPAIAKKKIAKFATKTGGTMSYKYAPIGDIAKQIAPALAECGLSYRWEFMEHGNKMKVKCIVSHKDGHSEFTELSAGADASGHKNDIQQVGSTHTYLQRYSLIGALGLTTADEDNDSQSRTAKQEDDYLETWQQQVNQCKSRIELTALYTKNKKTVDSDPAIQAILKKRQDQLPAITKQTMP